ncbi:hypothetical protein ONZ43_g7692 [Nemania bipapillata]|uniref:Uncharacterized protein n=1 Tax=Nemania bipapillata TaxID=110536 RepID=A0ACC2HPL4_9PEZI|nr:hypothetical protein ONZ43_g7692 [Nemania bipapillata]
MEIGHMCRLCKPTSCQTLVGKPLRQNILGISGAWTAKTNNIINTIINNNNSHDNSNGNNNDNNTSISLCAPLRTKTKVAIEKKRDTGLFPIRHRHHRRHPGA